MIDVVELTGTIDTLRNNLDFDHRALLAAITLEERQALRISIEYCTLELQRLLYRLLTSPLNQPTEAIGSPP